MGGKSQPNMAGAAAAQGEANREVVRDQTFANRPDQYTPWGATTWNPYQTVDPATGEATTAWEQTQSLTPELQEILNKQIAIQNGRSDVAGALTGRMGTEFGTPMRWEGLNPMGEIPTNQFTIPEEIQRNLDLTGLQETNDPYQTRQAAEDAVYNQAQSRLQPAQAGQKQALELKMRNQGLSPEDAAWKSQMAGLEQTHTDQTNQALWSANQAGRDEAGQMFGQQMDRRNQQVGERGAVADFFNQSGSQAYQQAMGANQANFDQAMRSSQYANQIRQQQMTEAMTQRGFSLNEINALLSGQQVNTPQMPQFNAASAAQAAPIYQGAADQASINAASSPWNAIGSIAGAGLGAAGAAGGFGNLFG